MNIINGHSAAGTFKQAFHVPGEDLLVFSDVLSCGPLGEINKLETWLHDRQTFWDAVVDDNAVEDGPYAFNSFPRDFYTHLDELHDADEIKLWVGTGLSDQLLLAFLLYLLAQYDVDLSALRVFQYKQLAGKQHDIPSLGILNPAQFLDHLAPYTPDAEQIALAASAWQAVSAPSPDRYLAFIRPDEQGMPLLRRAMRGLLFRYPTSPHGLSIWDGHLLRHTEAHGPAATRIIGHTLGDCMDALDLVGDFYLFSRLKRMGKPSLRAPLVEANALDLPMRHTHFTLTQHGKNVLAGKANAIQLNGIDDWVGGVHLDSTTGSLWLRQGETLVARQL